MIQPTFEQWTRQRWHLVVATIIVLLVAPNALQAQGNRVELEIVVGNDVSIELRQEWNELLGRVGADSVRMRTAQPGDQIRVTAEPLGDRELCKMVGRLTGRNQVVLPGGTFGRRDLAKIRELIQKIRDDGAQLTLSDKKAFGLIAEELVSLHRELSRVHTESTKGIDAAHTIVAIGRALTTPLEFTSGAKQALSDEYLIEDELSGLSSGTTLAAVLRPLGLVAVPHRPQGERLRIVIMESESAEEHWPIGWPIEDSESRTAPQAYHTFSVRVENFPLRNVLDAIEKRMGIPFVYDYNSFAENGIELNEAEVTLVDEKIGYASAIRKLLRSSRLRVKAEMRVDEAGKPFFWFTTLR